MLTIIGLKVYIALKLIRDFKVSNKDLKLFTIHKIPLNYTLYIN